MADTVKVYVVAGLNAEGSVVELAKFFSHDDAHWHMSNKFSAIASKQALYREVGIITRDEPMASQHSSHWEHIGYKPKGS